MADPSTEAFITSGDDTGNEFEAFLEYVFACNIIIGTVGVIGNFLVVVVILRSVSMRRKLANLFIVNQSVVDAVSSALLIGTYATDLARFYGRMEIVTDPTCKWWVNQASLWAGFTTSTFNLIALNFERYLGIVYPVFHKTTFTRGKALVMMAAVWICGYGYGWAYAVPTSGVVDGSCEIITLWPSDFWMQFFGITNLAVQFLLPLAIMAHYYIRMIVVLRRKSRVGPAHASGTQHSVASTRSQKKILKMLLIITMCFVLCWSWNEMLVTLMSFGYGVELSGAFFEFSVVMVFLNCCCNPFIYAFKHEEFRKALSKMFGRKNKTAPHTSIITVSGASSVISDEPSPLPHRGSPRGQDP